jgi:hypothetical protein
LALTSAPASISSRAASTLLPCVASSSAVAALAIARLQRGAILDRLPHRIGIAPAGGIAQAAIGVGCGRRGAGGETMASRHNSSTRERRRPARGTMDAHDGVSSCPSPRNAVRR